MNKLITPLMILVVILVQGCAIAGVSMRKPNSPPEPSIEKESSIAIVHRKNFKDSEAFVDLIVKNYPFRIMDFNKTLEDTTYFQAGKVLEKSMLPANLDGIDFLIYPFDWELKLQFMPAGFIGYGTWYAYYTKVSIIEVNTFKIIDIFEVKGFDRNWSLNPEIFEYKYNESGSTETIERYSKSRIQAVVDFDNKLKNLIK